MPGQRRFSCSIAWPGMPRILSGRGSLLIAVVAWVAAVTSTPDSVASPPLSGEFQLVSIRKSNLAMATPEDPGLAKISPGDRIVFDEVLTWLAGERCAEWSLQPAASPDIAVGDDMLSDTQVTAERLDPALTDHRVNHHLVLYCGITARAPLLIVDERVLVTTSPTRQSYVLFERTSGPDLAHAVEASLKSMKFFEAEPDGTLNAETRRAIARFAGYLGAAYDFNASPLTENLLEAMGLGRFTHRRPPGAWTDAQIAAEMARFRFRDAVRVEDQRFIVVSGFFPGEGQQGFSPGAAEAALDETRAFLSGLPNVAYSTLAERLVLLKLERVGDWDCATGVGCYPEGHVVGLGPVEPEQAGEICRLFRNNDWFCALPEN